MRVCELWEHMAPCKHIIMYRRVGLPRGHCEADSTNLDSSWGIPCRPENYST